MVIRVLRLQRQINDIWSDSEELWRKTVKSWQNSKSTGVCGQIYRTQVPSKGPEGINVIIQIHKGMLILYLIDFQNFTSKAKPKNPIGDTSIETSDKFC